MPPKKIADNIKLAVSKGLQGSQEGDNAELKKEEAAAGGADDDALERELAKQGKPLKAPTEVIKTSSNRTKEQIIKERGYELQQKLGAGAFATVYKAVKLSENLVSACKVIDTTTKKRQRYNDLKHELYVLEKVRHENVIRGFEHFIIDDFVYIFLEFAPAGTVSDFVRTKGPLSEKKAKQMFREMTAGIQNMHIQGISHRDIKLGNILLNEKGQCKVTDFGLSRISHRKDKGILYCNKYSGTEPYMSPEILCLKFKSGAELKKWTYDPLIADVWALGICLYALINKAYPFNPEDKELMLYNQLQRKWKFVKKLRQKLSDEVKDLVRHLIEPEVNTRITCHGIMAHPWLNTEAGEDGNQSE